MNKPTLDALRDIANSYCKGEEIQRVLLEEVLERFICLADEKLTSSEYVHPSSKPVAWAAPVIFDGGISPETTK